MEREDEGFCGEKIADCRMLKLSKFNKVMLVLSCFYSLFVGSPSLGGYMLSCAMIDGSVFIFCLGLIFIALIIFICINCLSEIRELKINIVLSFFVATIIFGLGFFFGLVDSESRLMNNIFIFVDILMAVSSCYFCLAVAKKRQLKSKPKS